MLVLPTAEPRKRMTLKDLPLCCQDKESITQYWERPDLRVTICGHCGHKYRRLFAEPGSLGALLGGKG